MTSRARVAPALMAVAILSSCSHGVSASDRQSYQRWKADYDGYNAGLRDTTVAVPGQSLAAFSRHCSTAIKTLNRGFRPLQKDAPTNDLRHALYQNYKAEYDVFAACVRNQDGKMQAGLGRLAITSSRLDERIAEADKHFGVSD